MRRDIKDNGTMDSSQKMDVVDWEDSPPAVAVKTRVPRRFLSPSLIGILGTLLLHALAIQSVPWGGGPKTKPPEIPESAAALAKSKADPAESLLLISLPTIAASNEAAAQSLLGCHRGCRFRLDRCGRRHRRGRGWSSGGRYAGCSGGRTKRNLQ